MAVEPSLMPEEPDDQAGANADGQAQAPKPPITMVICDDHPAYAKGLAVLLKAEAPDFEVIGTAVKATDAVRMAEELAPDVILMDLRMPGTDGLEATRLIRTVAPDTKVVILTVSDESNDLYQAMRAGASGFVTKEKEVAEIADAVRSVFRGHLVIPVDLAAGFLQDISDADLTQSLTEIETEILASFVRGETNREIAAAMHLSERTVSRRIDELYQKLHFSDRIQAAIWASQKGIGTPKGNGH